MTTAVTDTSNPFDFLNHQKVANSNATQDSSTQDASSLQLGQNQFLQLLLAQLKNQDPMQPQDPSAFLSQLAQFSTVTGVQGMQESISQLTDSMRSSQALSGASLVGHDVLAPAKSVTVAAGAAVSGAADIPDGASAAQVQVRDASGQLIRVFSMPAGAGVNDFTWDGLTSSGTAAPAGTYDFQVVANVGGTAVAADPMLRSRVASVTMDGSNLTLNTNAGTIALSDVKRVM